VADTINFSFFKGLCRCAPYYSPCHFLSSAIIFKCEQGPKDHHCNGIIVPVLSLWNEGVCGPELILHCCDCNIGTFLLLLKHKNSPRASDGAQNVGKLARAVWSREKPARDNFKRLPLAVDRKRQFIDTSIGLIIKMT
jgi:hypothetical protein